MPKGSSAAGCTNTSADFMWSMTWSRGDRSDERHSLAPRESGQCAADVGEVAFVGPSNPKVSSG